MWQSVKTWFVDNFNAYVVPYWSYWVIGLLALIILIFLLAKAMEYKKYVHVKKDRYYALMKMVNSNYKPRKR